ncbi:D-2-hydroxyacid dehydrogenase [Lysinibacillus sp. KU-BSD001]|uniref:D-2-hydroxyacid dehydrogenase n=1 Tax=Lysinibacillus sp. KU-BSD001 TaxID=3141328 RepID=UPI0036EEC9ED
MRVYFTFEPRPDLSKPLVEEFPEVEFIFEQGVRDDVLRETDILVTYGEDLTDDKIAVAEKLQWIFVASAGVEKMPAQAIAERGIYVSNVRGIHKKPMTESILAHILSLKRGLPSIYAQQARSEWNKKIRLTELNGSTALILGPGAIGQEIGRILQAFDVHTIGINSSGAMTNYMNETYPIAQLLQHLPKADIVISMLPSTPNTKNLIGREHFEVMKESAIFMNFGRGDLVAEDVLVQALQENLIAHAVLDVYAEEPLPANSPIWQLKNVTVSPHLSSHSSRYVERSLEIFKPSLRKWLNGERQLENEMDLLRGY